MSTRTPEMMELDNQIRGDGSPQCLPFRRSSMIELKILGPLLGSKYKSLRGFVSH